MLDWGTDREDGAHLHLTTFQGFQNQNKNPENFDTNNYNQKILRQALINTDDHIKNYFHVFDHHKNTFWYVSIGMYDFNDTSVGLKSESKNQRGVITTKTIDYNEQEYKRFR